MRLARSNSVRGDAVVIDSALRVSSEDPLGHARRLERADAHAEHDLRGRRHVVEFDRAQLRQRPAETSHDLALDDAAARRAELGHQHAADDVLGALGVSAPERDLLVDARLPQLTGVGARLQRVLERRALEPPAAPFAAHQHGALAVLDDRARLLAGRTERQDRFRLFRPQRHPRRLREFLFRGGFTPTGMWFRRRRAAPKSR